MKTVIEWMQWSWTVMQSLLPWVTALCSAGIVAVFIYIHRQPAIYRQGLASHLSHVLYELLRSSTVLQFFMRLFTKRKVSAGLPEVSNVEKVSERVYRILGRCNTRLT